jgi:hypothetical protein
LAFKQGHAYVGFQLFDLHGHCGRGDVQGLGGFGKTQVFGDRVEKPELSESGVLQLSFP